MLCLNSHTTHAHPCAPQAVAELTYQYRMNENIQLLANTLVYDHALKCGSSDVATSLLQLHDSGGAGCGASPSPFPSWVDACLEPARRVVFLDTDCLGQDAWEASRVTATAQRVGGTGVCDDRSTSSSSSPSPPLTLAPFPPCPTYLLFGG